MNLFELAHHPDAWKSHLDSCEDIEHSEGPTHWWDGANSTREQFELLNAHVKRKIHIENHTDENEFRMHLLFVHWATLVSSPEVT